MEGLRGCLRSRAGDVREPGDGAPAGGARRHGTDGSLGLELLVHRQLPDGGRPDQHNPHATSSDIAFWGDLAYVGDYGGFRIFDISEPTPTLVSDVRCYGPQADPSVFRHLNPQLQERVIPTTIRWRDRGTPRTFAQGAPAPTGASIRSARPFDK